MGVPAPGSAHARPSARPPIAVSENFPAHISPKFRNPGGRGVYLEAHAKFWNPTSTPSGILVTVAKEKNTD